MELSQNILLTGFLEQFIMPARMEKFRAVLSERTRHLTVVLEDIFQPQNASAVLRSCECFGIQDVHIIENENTFEINPEVVMGASKWLSLYQYNQLESNTTSCLLSLKDKGYRLIATSPLPDSEPLQNLSLDNKTALMFGNELQGLSPIAMEMADGFMHIPMLGFTESYNISVSVALCLQHLREALRSQSIPWQLPGDEYQELLLDWMKKTLKNPEALVRYFQSQKSRNIIKPLQ